VKRRLTFSSCESERDCPSSEISKEKDVMSALLALSSHEDESRLKLPNNNNNNGGSLPRGGLVGCEYEYTVMNSQAGKDYEEGEEEEGRAYPASSEAQDHDHEAKQQRKLRNASSVFSPSSSNSDNNNNNNKKGTASHQQHQPDWANGLPPDFVEMLATHLKDSCCEGKEGDRLDWGSVQDVYNAAAVCTRWRDFIQRSCFLRTSDTNNDQQRQRDSGRTKIRRKKTLADEMLCHPHQLLEKAATNEDVIKCYIVRERHKSPFCSKKYRLKLGADYLKANGKTLLVAHHQLLATKSAYNIYLSSADGGYPATQRLAQLHSSPYGTLFELHSSKKTKSGSIRRTKSGDIKYTFNMLGKYKDYPAISVLFNH
jgi:hypothetical protein